MNAQTKSPTHRPLDFIGIRDVNTERDSSLGIHGRLGNGALSIIGNLEHNAQIVPKSPADADKLISWLQEWKAGQPPASLSLLRQTAHFVAFPGKRKGHVSIRARRADVKPRQQTVNAKTWAQLSSYSDSEFDGAVCLEIGVGAFLKD